MTTTDTTEVVDIAKLESQASELRGAMMKALTAGNDAETKKLGNELAATNKRILDGKASAQAGDRATFMASQHDALAKHEMAGMSLTVKWAINGEGQETFSAAYTPDASVIDAIKASLVSDRPSTVTQFTYGRDESGEHSFEFGKATTKRASNGTSTPGWAKDNVDATLGDAFKAVATKAEQAEHDGKDNTSKQYAVKVRVVKAAGYTKR